MRILIVKSVFCPNDLYYELSVITILKISLFIKLLIAKNSDLTFDVLFIGWINEYSIRFDEFLRLYQIEFGRVHKELWGLNYGKYKVYNYMIDFVNSSASYDCLIYLDHDIHFDFSSVDTFPLIQYLKDHKINEHKVGLVAFNQLGDVRHQKDIYETIHKLTCKRSDIDSVLNILVPSRTGSIASGCFLIFTDVVANMKHFDMLSIYGLDDYYIDTQLIESGYINVVIDNVYCIHPFDTNIDYVAWKKNHMLNLITGLNTRDPSKHKTTYYQEVQNSINFWSN